MSPVDSKFEAVTVQCRSKQEIYRRGGPGISLPPRADAPHEDFRLSTSARRQ